jgi:hypothetical protein
MPVQDEDLARAEAKALERRYHLRTITIFDRHIIARFSAAWS